MCLALLEDISITPNVADYVLVAIVRKPLGLDISLYTFLQVLSVSLFEKTPISQAFQHP